MQVFDPKKMHVKDFHQVLLGSVAPRPIAFASTLDEAGTPNLAPYSFFNAFGSNPATVIISPARRGRDNTTKHTYENLKKNKEVVINIVNYEIVQQMVLASTEYADGVNEFEKSGLTATPSVQVAPPRVKEAPVQLECKLRDIINYGELPGAGNMMICEVVLVHVNEAILGSDGIIDPYKLDPVGRLGKLWYTRAKEGLFEIPNPSSKDNISFEKLPEAIKHSTVLTGNDLAKLAKQPDFPTHESIAEFKAKTPKLATLSAAEVHQEAKAALDKESVEHAWKLLLAHHG